MLDRTTALIELHVDIETRATVDLRRQGVRVYAQDPNTDVWCVCYAWGNGPIEVWLPDQPCPPEIVEHVMRGGLIWAHNVAFERSIWTYILGPRYRWPIPRWEVWGCTMARAYANALPGGLDQAARAVGLALGKDKEGHRLMMKVSKPRGTNVATEQPYWWNGDDVNLKRLVYYCQQDVLLERNLHSRVLPLSAREHRIWQLDQKMNDHGLLVDRELGETAAGFVEDALYDLDREIKRKSGGFIQKTSNVAQILAFVNNANVRIMGAKGKPERIDSIHAHKLDQLLGYAGLPSRVRKVLEIRREAAKVSVKKIRALLADSQTDGRARGLLAYHAATTGRWAGRRFQPQNIKRPDMKDQNTLIKLIQTKDHAAMNFLGGPIAVVSDMIRGLIIAAPGHELFAADFSNIEGRGLAWLVGEDWKVKAYTDYDEGRGPDLYNLAYSRAFHVPIDQIDSDMRQVGKVMELALGYAGGIGAFQTMAAAYGVTVSNEEADDLKKRWRAAHPCTVQFWYDIEQAAIKAVENPEQIIPCGRIRFYFRGSTLQMRLPSARSIHYPYPEVHELPVPWDDEVKRPMLTYMTTINPSNARRLLVKKIPKGGIRWGRISAYGGLLTENAVQGLARDIMADAMLRLDAAGFPLTLTVHDEIVAEAPVERSLEEFEELVEVVPDWAEGFPVAAEAWRGPRYKKG